MNILPNIKAEILDEDKLDKWKDRGIKITRAKMNNISSGELNLDLK
jgi:hypothetical protein